ncbi:MAG: DJ-1/PfpI family protein [Betaproteobacteria bacterium]|nr:MAG: DJ-1/PfpI family protein [Betaproteobacteria bacterium]
MKFGLLLYPGVEPIDLATVGVLSMASRVVPQIEYTTVAANAGAVPMSNGLRVMADLSFADAPDLDVVIVPGGPGWVRACEDKAMLDYLSHTAKRVRIVSVCTGAMILAAAGLLDGKSATTKVEIVPPEDPPLDILTSRYGDVETRHALIVDEGRIVTGGGVTLCIDTILYVIEREFGKHQANEVARIMEYRAAREANAARLPTFVGA